MIGRSTYKALVAIFNRQREVREGKVVLKPRPAATAFRTRPTPTPPTTPTKDAEGESSVSENLAPDALEN